MVVRRSAETLVTQSLVDRLSDFDDWPNRRESSLRLFRESLKRDVEWLLNTRRPPIAGIEEYELANNSVLMYGLPDIGMFEGSPGRDPNALLAALVKTLRTFEPRIRDPRVSIARSDVLNRTIRFHVEGQVGFENSVEDISFDTVLELVSGEYEVK
jgi:type VI secretion system protein ImpF